MKKYFKGLFTFVIAVMLFIPAVVNASHLVQFIVGDEVNNCTANDDSLFPAYQIPLGYEDNEHADFYGWFKDEYYQVQFDFDNERINEDTKLYGKWLTKEEPVYTIVYDFNGGTKMGLNKWTVKSVGFVPMYSEDTLINGTKDNEPVVIPPTGMKLVAFEVDGVRKDLGTGVEVNHDMTIKYIWASAISGGNSTIVDTTQTVNKINVLGVIAPVAGQTPDVSTITTDTEGVTISKATWIKESENKVLTSTDTFEAHQKYVLVLETLPKAYYVFAKEIGESNITVNEKYLMAEFIEERPELRLYYEASAAVVDLKELKQTGASTKTITLAWNKNDESNGYLVQVKSGKKWKTVSTITNNNTVTKTIKKLKAGKKYTYRVLSYKNVKKVVKKKTKTVKETINTTDSVVAMTTPSAPTAVIKGSAHDYVKVSYKKKVGGASKYILYKSTSKNGTYTEVTEFTGTYTDIDVKTGTTYYYKVKACNANGFCGGNSKAVSKKPSLGKLSIKAKSPESGKILITPKTVSGEDGYVLEMSTKKNKDFKEVANLDVATKEFLDEGYKGKKTYYVRARAYKVVDGNPVYGAWSSVQKVTVKK